MDLFDFDQNDSFIDSNLAKLNSSEDSFHLVDSINFLVFARKLNLIISLCVILVGLVGNSLTIYIFSHKKLRSNSNNIYLLCLSLVDSLFLVNHFFDDVLKAYVSIYLNNENNSQDADDNTTHFLFKLFKYESICGLFNFFRYTLGFISSYTLTAFTVQRLSIVLKPLSSRYKSKQSAWQTFSIITLLSIFLNLWALCMFKLQKNQQDITFCEINKDFRNEYFSFNGIYIFFIMFLPLFIIIICNSCIIYKTVKDDKNRQLLQQQVTATTENFELKKTKNCSLLKRSEASNNICGLLIDSTNNLNIPKFNDLNKINNKGSNYSLPLTETPTEIQSLNLLDPKRSIVTIKNIPSLHSLNENRLHSLKKRETSNVTSNMSYSVVENKSKKSIVSSTSNSFLAQHSLTKSNLKYKKRNAISRNSKKVTKSLMIISVSYVLLNLPFLITCFLYFYEVAHNKFETISKNYLFSAFKISEVFYVFNFGIKFYIYCLTGPMLQLIQRKKKKKQLKFNL